MYNLERTRMPDAMAPIINLSALVNPALVAAAMRIVIETPVLLLLETEIKYDLTQAMNWVSIIFTFAMIFPVRATMGVLEAG